MYIIPQLRGEEIVKYLRKSRKDDPLLTIEEVLEKHDQEIKEWLAVHLPEAGPIPEANIFREVVSGETIEDRPKMKELLRLIESPKIKAIVCKEPSRLSRGDLMDIGYLVKILRYTGTLVLTTRGSYDLRDDRDREQFERELMRGNDYLEYQKKIMKDGKLLAVKNGCYIGATAPYGYRKVSIKVDKRTCHTLTPHPEEAEVVKRIFEMYAQGLGAIRICDVLDMEHMRPRGGKKWAPETISTILNNVHYLGKVRWNRVRHGHRVEDGEIIKSRTIAEDYLVFEGRHDAIISQELWDAAQNAKNSIPRSPRSTELRNPLARVLYCTCGKAMVYKQTTNKGKLIGEPRFICGDQRCRATGSAKMSEVMEEVARVLRECVADFEIQIDKGVDNSAELHKQLIGRLEKKLTDLRELELKQWDEKTRGGMPDHVFQQLNARTVAEIEEVNQALCEAIGSAPVHVDLSEKLTTFRAALQLLQDPDAPPKAQNKLIQACIERIVYSRPPVEKIGGRAGNSEPFHLDFTLRV